MPVSCTQQLQWGPSPSRLKRQVGKMIRVLFLLHVLHTLSFSLAHSFDNTELSVLRHIALHFRSYVDVDCSAYWTTAILSEIVFVWFSCTRDPTGEVQPETCIGRPLMQYCVCQPRSQARRGGRGEGAWFQPFAHARNYLLFDHVYAWEGQEKTYSLWHGFTADVYCLHRAQAACVLMCEFSRLR